MTASGLIFTLSGISFGGFELSGVTVTPPHNVPSFVFYTNSEFLSVWM
jgi:hypothetical protein